MCNFLKNVVTHMSTWFMCNIFHVLQITKVVQSLEAMSDKIYKIGIYISGNYVQKCCIELYCF